MHADDDFSRCFDFASGATAERFQNPLWRVTELFTGRRFRQSVSVVKDFGRRIVASAVRDRNEQRAKQASDGDTAIDEDGKLDQISGSLIQSLLEAIGNEQMVADAALTYLSAGRDTTAQALTWTFYLLTQHPEVVAKIRAEAEHLMAAQHNHNNNHNHQQPLQEEEKKGEITPTLFTPTTAPYANAVFHEALRLYPPIPFEIRQCQADTTLPDGTFLPKHSVLVWCLWAMQRSRLTWGEDAGLFRPERFLSSGGSDSSSGDGEEEKEEEVRFKSRSAAEFPVFYGGARACLGRKMAEAIAAQVIPTVVCGFEVEAAWEEEGAPGGRRSSTSLTLPMEGGLPVRVRVRATPRDVSAAET